MIGRAAILATLASCAPVVASAQQTRIHIQVCDADAIDVGALQERIALELATDPRELAPDDAPLEVRVTIECAFRGASVLLRSARGERFQRVDLGEAVGMGRTWALALVVADLVRSTARTEPREEEDSSPPPRRALTDSVLGAGPRARLYFDHLTLLAGLELTLSHDWFRVSIAGLGTEVAAGELGRISASLWLLELAARPLTAIVGDVLIGAELAVTGGLVHGAGRPAGDDVDARDAIELVLGASIALRARWAFDASVASELALSAGYDLLGAALEAGIEPVATIHGARVELSLTFLLAP